jgi:hypothetical protein
MCWLAVVYSQCPRTKHSTNQLIIISGSRVLVRTLATSHWRFRNLIIKTLVTTPLDERPARRKSLYLHRTTQYRNVNTNIHAPSGIRTHNHSNQEAKTCTLDHVASGTGQPANYSNQFIFPRLREQLTTWIYCRQPISVSYPMWKKYLICITYSHWLTA